MPCTGLPLRGPYCKVGSRVVAGCVACVSEFSNLETGSLQRNSRNCPLRQDRTWSRDRESDIWKAFLSFFHFRGRKQRKKPDVTLMRSSSTLGHYWSSQSPRSKMDGDSGFPQQRTQYRHLWGQHDILDVETDPNRLLFKIYSIRMKTGKKETSGVISASLFLPLPLWRLLHNDLVLLTDRSQRNRRRPPGLVRGCVTFAMTVPHVCC